MKNFNHLFWHLSRDKRADIDHNAVAHQVLALGTMDDLKKLFSLYGKKNIRREFMKPKAGLYQPSVLEFCRWLLGVKTIDKKKYLKKIV